MIDAVITGPSDVVSGPRGVPSKLVVVVVKAKRQKYANAGVMVRKSGTNLVISLD